MDAVLVGGRAAYRGPWRRRFRGRTAETPAAERPGRSRDWRPTATLLSSHIGRMPDENRVNPGNLLTLFGTRIIHLRVTLQFRKRAGQRWLGLTDGSGNLRKLTTAGILLILILDLVGAAAFVHWLTPNTTVTVLRGSQLATDVGFSQIFKALGKFRI